ncbi:MAG TPA: RNA methyltransferase [Caldisericia bacterium]|nr:RNA methyltransferase [Caldisericia bacterium]HPF48523.1 RNA methyltransferase [Caldisericia bacterium]HPI84607.1 RNA methyltransferase [Caldisericia bacterium]HPQ92978.1 RNA methyltransferase [Caldisericia bacterium]HRV75188.1 RNA methyltransferase [Caldisericia bacterium]
MFAISLVHHPVLDRRGDIQASSVTPFDIHDISRSSKTYGISKFYVTHPAPLQRGIVERILGFWEIGGGKQWNPHRSNALQVACVIPTLKMAIEDFTKVSGQVPQLVATTARETPNSISYEDIKKRFDKPTMFVFGTGWGLTQETLDMCDLILKPIYGPTDFNHLSVRAAVAIILDRLFGR